MFNVPTWWLTENCGTITKEYLWLFCLNGEQLVKGYDVVVSSYEDGSTTVSKTEYFDVSTNELVEIEQTDVLTPGACVHAEVDYEKSILCAADGTKVLVEHFFVVNEEEIEESGLDTPPQTMTIRYTNLVTGEERTGDPATLVACVTEKFDVQTKQFCDEGTTIFGTLVFDVQGSIPVLEGIVYHKIDGTPHTAVAPIEGACEPEKYNTPGIIEVDHENTFTLAANTYHSVSINVIQGTASIGIDWTTVNNLQAWYTANYTTDLHLSKAITITADENSRVVLTYVK